MGAGASSSNAPPEGLRGPKKEARRMQNQVKEIGMNKDDLQMLVTAFGLLPSYQDGTVRPQDIALLPQLAAVPLIGRVAMLYANEQGRLPMKELVNLVTEWSDVEHGGRAAPAADGDGVRPLGKADRFRKVFDACDADGSGTVTVTELVQLFVQLSGGTVDGAELRRSLMQGPAAAGVTFEQFSQLVSSEELLTKTTVRIG
jgi:hypothetical protein